MRRPAIALVLLALCAAGCGSWHTSSAPAPQTVADMRGQGSVRITRADHAVLVLRNPQVTGDSIVGEAGNPPQRTAVALGDVQRVERRGTSATKTGGLVLAGAIVVSVVALGLAIAAFSSEIH